MHICLRLPPPLPIHGDRPTSVHMKIFCEPSGGLIRRSIAATIRLFRPSGIKNSEQRRINSCSSSQQVARTADTLMTANPDVHRGTVSKFTFEHEAVVAEIDIAASPERVFQALTDEKQHDEDCGTR